MKLSICYLGLLAERRGLAEETLETSVATARDLYQVLDTIHRLGLATTDFRVAVNDEFVAWDHLLRDGDSVALLPPMSGG